MQKRVRAGIFAITIAVASAITARADAILTFTPSIITTNAGGTVEFDGVLTNTGTTGLYLNSDTFDLEYPDLSVGDSPFFFFGPTFLAAGDSYAGAFIDVTADAATPSWSYSGTYTIQGGADSNTFDDLATADFTVDVGSSTTPEPNSFLLFATGLSIITVVCMRHRCSASIE